MTAFRSRPASIVDNDLPIGTFDSSGGRRPGSAVAARPVVRLTGAPWRARSADAGRVGPPSRPLGGIIKRRLDAEMVRRGLSPSRETARRLIEANGVLVDGSFAAKPARMVDPGQSIELVGPPPRFVGRGGEKLAGALESFPIDPTGAHCLDAGSSTGGFTDCLLQAGAASVTAVDVGTNQLHERLRADPRVVVMEQTDVRTLSPERFDRGFELIVGDLSFISLKLVLPAIVPLATEGGDLMLLVKPQFEAGRQEASKGRGIITDPTIWRRVLIDVVEVAGSVGAGLQGVTPSPISGSAGNTEFVTWLQRGRPTMPGSDGAIEAAVRAAMDRAGRSPAGSPSGDGRGDGAEAMSDESRTP